MKTRLLPLYFDPGRDDDFDRQLRILSGLLGDAVEWLKPIPLGAHLPAGANAADAVVFPQLLGESYRRVKDFKSLRVPILIVTAEFGTLSMWDWEIITYLRAHGIDTIAPYNLQQTRRVCAALSVKRELRGAKFLVFQDNPGEGEQASIFKRFYWWEDECSRLMLARFGVSVVKKSYRQLCAEAKAIPDREAEAEWKNCPWPTGKEVTGRQLNSALKLYLAVRRELDADQAIRGIGANCLNESRFSDTTPCLAWCRLHQERRLTWGCEADTLSMLTQHLLGHALNVPVMMTNLYPFLLGDAALKHEHMDKFPKVTGDPADYLLAAHCGYMGLIPPACAAKWRLRKKVLAIVDENATAVDARFPTGAMTLAKLHPSMDSFSVAEGELEGYAQYPDSHCRNGGILRVRNGRRFMGALTSHHYVLLAGHQAEDIRMIAGVFNLRMEEV